MATDDFRNLCVWVFSKVMGKTFHGEDAFGGRVGFPSTLIARLHDSKSTEIERFVPYSDNKEEGNLVPIDCRKVKFMLWDWAP